MAATDTVTDGTAKFHVRDRRCKYRVGQIVAMMGTPASYDYMLLCDGSIINSTNYADLVSVLGGTTLPNLIGRFLEGGKTSGSYVNAGLPNVYGTFVNELAWIGNDSGVANGAFRFASTATSGNRSYASGTTYKNRTIIFDANRSNSTYGSSSTVQPPAMLVKYYICYTG